MDYTDWLLFKFLALVCAAVVINFFYSLFTGKILGQEQSDKATAEHEDL